MPRILKLQEIDGRVGVILDVPHDKTGEVILFSGTELRKHDNDIIEECARVSEQAIFDLPHPDKPTDTALTVALRIRELKEGY